MSNVLYSVVICTYNGSAVIGECLAALARQTMPKERYEVIVVDDGSTDGVGEVVRDFTKRLPSFHLITHEVNRGLSAARNTGWRAARGEIVLYTDDDAVPDDDWIERIAAEYDSDTVAGAGGLPRPYVDDAFSLYEIAVGLVRYGMNWERLDGAGGLNMSFRRNVLHALGGFDERFTHVADDADMNRRLTSAGYQLKVNPAITVRHRCPTNMSEFRRAKVRRGEGSRIFREKYRELPSHFVRLVSIVWNAVIVPRHIRVGFAAAEAIDRRDLRWRFARLAHSEAVWQAWGMV